MRVVVYDRTCVTTGGRMSPIWATGASLFRRLGRIDIAHPVASWDEAFARLAESKDPITELQYWGHGKWGGAYIGEEFFDVSDLVPGARRRPVLEAVRERLAPDALVWFRTCETFGAMRGLDFASRLGDFLGTRVAGHTYVIHFYQSGLHGRLPGQRPTWSPSEGIAEGTPATPRRARTSAPWSTHTMTCLGNHIPPAWFT